VRLAPTAYRDVQRILPAPVTEVDTNNPKPSASGAKSTRTAEVCSRAVSVQALGAIIQEKRIKLD